MGNHGEHVANSGCNSVKCPKCPANRNASQLQSQSTDISGSTRPTTGPRPRQRALSVGFRTSKETTPSLQLTRRGPEAHPPCTFLGLRPSYVTGIGALTTMYVGSEQCSYFAYFEQSTEHRYIISSGQGSSTSKSELSITPPATCSTRTERSRDPHLNLPALYRPHSRHAT